VNEVACAPNLVSPINGAILADAQPDLVWQTNPGELRTVIITPRLDTDPVTVPIELVSLGLTSAEPLTVQPDGHYRWQVDADIDTLLYIPGYPFVAVTGTGGPFLFDIAIDGDGDSFTGLDGDCDDGDASVFPGAPELDNGTDDDCDGTVDEGFDTDGDGFTPIFGFDCDDTDETVFPGAPESFNGVDDDCDGTIDNGVSAEGAFDELTDVIEDLGDDGTLNNGQENSLTQKLENILAKLNKGQTNAACNQLGAFENQVLDLVANGILTTTEGQALIDASSDIENALGC